MPDAKPSGHTKAAPCGECHLKPGEVCDICGAAAKGPERRFHWRWPVDGQAWFAWAFQNYGSRWIVWRVGPLNYRVEVAAPGQSGGWIGRPPAMRV